VLVLTGAVWFAGAAGMYALEPGSEVTGGFSSYWDALWWTGMLASFFIGRDAHSSEGEVAGAREMAQLRGEIAKLRKALAAMPIDRGQESFP
jgi:hypothetical protein